VSTCVVTGSSSGIGADIARELARRGRGVTLVARREDRLKLLADELSTAHHIRAEVIPADLTDPEARAQLVATVAERGLEVDVLVNNAGFGIEGLVAQAVTAADRARQLAMLRTNVEAPIDLTMAWLPAMIERGQGAILNVASTAAFQPLPGSASYAASKAYVLSFTEALHEELRGTGVTATALCPGPVKTEFIEVATGGEPNKVGKPPAIVWTSSAMVARSGIDAMLRGRRVVVPGLLNRIGAFLAPRTPRPILLPIVRRFNPLSD